MEYSATHWGLLVIIIITNKKNNKNKGKEEYEILEGLRITLRDDSDKELIR